MFQTGPIQQPGGVHALRVVYMGMTGAFSIPPLTALLDAGIAVRGVIVPAMGRGAGADRPAVAPIAPEQPRSPLPLANPYVTPSIVHLAWKHAIPVFEVRRLAAPETRALFAELGPDLVCVACFPQRIPSALLALPPLGVLNLHPSLLPAYRGPAPLFWAFRNGERTTGVTVHFMDEGLDTGDIAVQAPITLPDGISGAEAERRCATLGARLLVETVQALEHGTPARRPQSGGSYYPWPTPEDFAIDTAWPARRAFNFMRGTAEWGQPYPVEAGGTRLLLGSALAYAADERLNVPCVRSGDEVRIQFTPGVLRARMA
jgi:methionyl-tRNA formyltransferase